MTLPQRPLRITAEQDAERLAKLKKVDCCACGTTLDYTLTAEMRKLTGGWGEPNSLLCDTCAKALAQQSPAKGPEHDPR